MSPWNPLLLLLSVAPLLSFLPTTWAGTRELYTLTVNEKGERVVSRVDTVDPRNHFKTIGGKNVVAKALRKEDYLSTGWDFFEVSTNEAFPDEEQAYAAGFMEGSVTHDAIYNHWYNSLENFCEGKKDICEELEDFVKVNYAWVQNISQSNGSDYWHQVKLYYRQIEGVADGYASVNKNKSRDLGRKELFLLNNPDLSDIVEMIKAKKSNFSDTNESAAVLGLLKCSALVKVLPDGSEMFSAQDTWSDYNSMVRYQKKYDFGFHVNDHSDKLIPGRTMTFSSYPGVVSSGDDFYVISSGLVTMETTIGNNNASLWKQVLPQGQVSEGARSMVANRLAQNGREWAAIFEEHNSGTYNNQWMVVDYKKFKKGTKPSKLPDDLLWVVEQIPSLVRSEDVTKVLRKQGYWASYNVAYFPEVFNLSGNQELVKKHGDWFTYDKTPRALMFNRDHVNVTGIKSMLSLMRYNDFQHDPLSKCNCTPPYSGENAIAARSDLNPKNGSYPFPALGHRPHGATDAKVTSLALYMNGLQFLAVSGPPSNATRGIPPFQWSKAEFANTVRHLGQPDLWEFQPLIYRWA